MESYLLYIGKVSLAAGAFYIAFLLLFQNQKQFVFNRLYLPVSLALSFVIPLITFTTVKYIEPSTFDLNNFAYLPSVTDNFVQPAFMFKWYHYLFGLYILGIVGFLLHLLLGHLKAFSIIRYSRIKELFNTNVNITFKDVHPFSFFNKIVLSEKTLDNPSLRIIVSHENIHVKEKHTLDILFVEILFLFQWFNPFAWLIKDAIQNNLEYKTDHQIAEKHNPQAYQLAMVGLADKKGVAPFLTALNGSQLKNRIIMMKKKTENKYAVLKQLVVLPLLAVLVMGLSSKEVRTEIVQPEVKTEIANYENTKTEKVTDQKETKEDSLITVTSSEVDSQVNKQMDMYVQYLGSERAVEKYFKKSIVTIKAEMHEVIQDKPLNKKIINEQLNTIKDDKKVTIKGKVTDQNGEPISGATIIIKGKTTGTITDTNGNYELQLDNENETLIFFVQGTIKKEVKVNGKTEINVETEYVTAHDVLFGDPTLSGYKEKKIEISGKVTDKNGDPISGASIIIKGKTIGAITDRSGNYSIKLDEENEILVFVMVGFENQEIAVGDKTEINVKLQAGNNQKPEEISITTFKSERNVTEQEKKYGGEIFYKVEELPEFPKGELALRNYIAKSIKYPEIALEKGIIGKVYVTFIIDKKGKVNDARIAMGVDPALDKEAIRVVNSLPKWKPGKQRGKIVNVSYTVPVNFVPTVKQIKKYSKIGLETKALEKRIEDNKKAIRIGNNTDPSKTPLYIVEGVEMDNIDEIDPENIESVSVLKGKSATELYGKKGKNGVILIATKPVSFDPGISRNPIIIVDGREFDGNINDIPVKDIISVEVKKNQVDNNIYNSKPPEKDKIIIHTKTKYNSEKKDPLIVINGIISDYKSLDNIDPATIKSVDVLKDASASKLYGNKAKNGVILITLKSLEELSEGELPIVLNGKLTQLTLNEVDRDLIQNINRIEPKQAVEKYGKKGKNGVFEITSRKLYTDKVEVKSRDKITTPHQLRKYIAENIRYPKEALNYNGEGTVSFYVKMGKTIEQIKVPHNKEDRTLKLDEVVVVAYKSEIGANMNYEKSNQLFMKEVFRVINMITSVEIPEFKDKPVGISVKFVLQN